MKSFFVEMLLLMGAEAPVSFDEAVVLGQGLSEGQTLTSSCLKGDITRLGQSVTRDSFSRLGSLEREPGILKLNFALESQVGREGLVHPQWRLPGDLIAPDPVTCGTQFIQETSLGGRLLVTVKFRLRDEAMLVRFTKETQIDRANLLTLGGSLTRILKSDGEMSLHLTQVGGQPERLNQLMEASALPLSCPIARPAACVALIQRLVRYGASPEGFWGQLRDAWQTGKRERLAVLHYRTAAYPPFARNDSGL